MPHRTAPVQSVQVYSADMLRVSAGANLGDGVSWHQELDLDDIYMLDAGADRARQAGFAWLMKRRSDSPAHRCIWIARSPSCRRTG